MRYRVASRRIQSIAGVVLTLVVGNFLLASYTLRVLNEEGEGQLADLRQYQEDEIIAEVRGRVETACLMIRHIADIYGDAQQAQQSAMAAASSIRFGENNYLWVHRLDPQNPASAFMLVHPADELRGRDNAGLIDLDRITHIYHEGEILPKTDPRVRYTKPVDLFAEFNRIALTKGEGIVSYFWPKIVDGKASPEGYRKVAFIKYLPEWHWVVGGGAYADDIDLLMKERAAQLRADQTALAWKVASGMGGFSLVIVFIVSFLGWRITQKQILELSNQVEERKRAEQALRASEERYKALFESAGDAIMTVEPPAWRFTSCNPATLRMFGAKDETAFVSETPWTLSPELQPDGQTTTEKARAVIKTALKEGSASFEWTHRRLDGEEFPAAVRLTRMEVGGKTLLQAIVRDMTDFKRMQDQLAQAQKMESIGRLAGGVAHDFNNLLTVILGYGQMLEEELPPDSTELDRIKQIMAAGERARDLTHQLLAFSRKQVLEMKALDLNELVDNMQKMLHRLLGEDIEIRVSLQPHPLPVNADSAQLGQVLMNLCVNARDAMPHGGTLTIETSVVTLESPATMMPGKIPPGTYAVLIVSDTGCGMDEATQRRIFDPFFTTKEKEKGTGLGLATVYGIVKQHDGDISVYSEPGHGTTFRIYLPTVGDARAKEEGPTGASLRRGNGETILVLEDDITVRALACNMLTRLGYVVIEARTAEECIELARAARKLDVLLTDLVMPGLNGRQVSDLVKNIRPEARVLYMSGYTADIIAHHGVLEEGVHFIPKPFDISDLSLKLQEVLSL